MKKLLTVLIVLALLGGGGYAYYYYNKPDERPQILTQKITRGDVIEQVQATGTLQALRTVQIGAQVSGVVKKLYVDFNSIVKANQVIAELDPTILQSNVDQAQANYDKANVDLARMRVTLLQNIADLKRNQDLHTRSLVTDQALEQADLTVKTQQAAIDSAVKGLVQLQAAVDQAKTNLGYATITSPIAGVVIQRNSDEGSTINSSTSSPTLFLLATDLTHMKLEAGVDESDVGKLHPDQDVTFTVEAYGHQQFHGTVNSVRLNSTTVQNVVTYQTEIDVINPDLKLRPGMTATLMIEIERATNVLRVPAAAGRFHPTDEMYAALGQAKPTQNSGRTGRAQDANGAAATPPAPGAAPTVATQLASAAPGGRGANANPLTADATAPAGRGNRQAGQGRGFGQGQNLTGRPGGGGTPATPEQRQKMQGMSPDERAKYMAANGIAAGGGNGRGGGGNGRGGGGRGAGAAGGAANAVQGPVTLAADRGANVIDQLYEPVQRPDASTTVYVVTGTPEKPELKSVRVRTGITDGQASEVLSGELQEGQEVVTSIVLPAKAAAGAANNLFMGQPQRGGPGQGQPGGGAGGARPGGAGGGGGGRGGL